MHNSRAASPLPTLCKAVAILFALCAAVPKVAAADNVQVALTGTRTQFTVAEPVEFAVLYQNDGGNARSLPLEIRHQDGSTLTVSLPFTAPAGQAQARLLSLQPGALKPGEYTAQVRLPGAAAAVSVPFAVHEDEHAGAYFVGAWMQRDADPGTALAKGGWMYYTSDLINASVRQPKAGDIMERYIAARMKPYSMTVMGGGHQLDLQQVNDWGDPWVQRAVIWKMGLAALSNRLYPSAGLHAFDEPGLTWWPITGPDGKVSDGNPYCIPTHLEEFKKLTGKQMPYGTLAETLPQYKPMMDTWSDFFAMRLKYLEQAWWGSVFAVDAVHAPFTTINQLASSYAPGDLTDGVDNRMNRPYPVLSGHGGYSDWAGSWGAVISGESYHGWTWDRPHLYLPMWGTWDYARMRQEVWLPWSTKLEGIEYDPNHNWGLSGGYIDTNTMFELAEVNRRLALVGDVMARMPRSLSPVAVLLSHRQFAYDVAEANYPEKLPGANGPYASAHREHVTATMRRIMSTGLEPNWIDEYEASKKGAAFLQQWKVIYCPGLATADAAFRKAIEGYIAGGGKFIQDRADRLHFNGAVLVDYPYTAPNPPTFEAGLFNDYAQRKYSLDLAPTFAADLAGWLGPQPYRSNAPLNTMLMSVHHAGAATYVLMGNNHQDPDNVRHAQMDPLPLDTTVQVPAGGVIYDLLNGGTVPVANGQAPLRLAAGDGACWLHLPAAPGPLRLSVGSAGTALQINLAWGAAGYLPFRLRIYDPAGNKVDELFRATTPGARTTTWAKLYQLGTNASPGVWTVETYEWLTGSTATVRVAVKGPAAASGRAKLDAGNVSIYFDDTRKIANLFAGKPIQPLWDRMHWDLKRVFNYDAKRFAVFGPDAAAQRIAAALKARGMSVEVNPKYEIVPFTREPGHGGTGPIQDQGQANFENIYAHAIVLPGHPLGENSWKRGHINRPVTATFPGPGRAYIQWGMGGYQAGYEDVWAFGDTDAAVNWLLSAIAGNPAANSSLQRPVVTARPVTAPPTAYPGRFTVTQQIRSNDTPAGIGASPDGKTTYVLLAGGSVAAYDPGGKQLWQTPALQQGVALAVSPKGDRIAVAGFPGLSVLDAADGHVLGATKPGPISDLQGYGASCMTGVAWNSAGTIAAAGWFNQATAWEDKDKVKAPMPALDCAVLNAQGKALPAPQDIKGNVMGVAFVPGSDALLIGADQLTAVNAQDGTVLWRNAIGGAQAFAFSADGQTGAAGGWGKNAGKFSLAGGKLIQSANFDSNVGGVAITPNGDVALAVWGGTHPLYVLRTGANQPEPLFQSRFGFQTVLWWPAANALAAAEEGGNLWLLDGAGKPRALLDDAGTTIHRMHISANALLVARMNRVTQRLAVQ